MRKYFRKCFLLFASLYSMPSVYAMENNRFSLALGSLYATLKSYLPTFPLPSFLPRYNFRRRNIEHNTKPNEIPLNTAEIAKENKKLDQEKNVEEKNNNQAKTDTNAQDKQTVEPSSPDKEILRNDVVVEKNNNPGKHKTPRKKNEPKLNFSEHYKQDNLKDSLPKNVDLKIDEKTSDIEFLDAVKTAQKHYFDRKEDFNVIQNYLNKGVNPDCPLDEFGQTLLMLAVRYDKKNLFNFLINKGANVHAYDIFGQTLLMLAVKYQKKELFRLLIEKGANINVRDIYGQTVLHKSMYRQLFCNFIKIKDLLTNKADPNILDKNNQTPLFVAIAQQCEPDIIQLLIDSTDSTNINRPNIYNVTPLGRAMYGIVHCGFFYKENILRILYKSGVSLINIDNQGNSVFHYLLGIDESQLKKLINSIIVCTHDFYKIEEGFCKIEDHKIENALQNSIISIQPKKQFSGDDTHEVAELLAKQKNHANFDILCSVMNHMIRIQEVLQHPNNNKETPWQLLHKKYGKRHIKNVKNLFNENKPEEDFKNLLKVFPNTDKVPEDNWAEIAYHYYPQKINALKYIQF